MTRFFFDWNATTPIHPSVLDVMVQTARTVTGNPASVHREGRQARASLEGSRKTVADFFSARPQDLVFTSGGTEATHLALFGSLPLLGGRLAVSAVEHASVGACGQKLGALVIGVTPEGIVDLVALERLLVESLKSPEGPVRLVSIQAASGEFGTIQPLREIAQIVHPLGALLHCDAVQAVGRIETARDVLDYADLVTLAAHKIEGPKGIGALLFRPGTPLVAQTFGGSHERGLRAGTQDPVLASGFAATISRSKTTPAGYQASAAARDFLESELVNIGSKVQGGSCRLPHVLHVTHPGWTGPELVAALDLEGVAASSGSACHAGLQEPSQALKALGPVIGAPIRFSLPPWTEMQVVVEATPRILGVFRRGGGL